MKKIKLTIEGMHCGACSGNVQKALSKVEGVKNSTVSIMTKKAIVQAEDSTREELIKEAISEVGYKVVNIE
jgi:copper chaperone CopZ